MEYMGIEGWGDWSTMASKTVIDAEGLILTSVACVRYVIFLPTKHNGFGWVYKDVVDLGGNTKESTFENLTRFLFDY